MKKEAHPGAGIYIHIPFCRKACHYCDFHFSVSTKNTSALCRSIIREARLREGFFTGETDITTIYFGGGTPSYLEPSLLSEILDSIRSVYACSSHAEITLEVNPEDCSTERLQQWMRAGFNRLSIGIQSFRDVDLQFMNRNHTSAEAVEAVKRAADLGFENISIDLIYGVPGLSLEDWKKNLELALSLPVQHLSAYCLTVEPRTVFGKMLVEKKWDPASEDVQREHFLCMVDLCSENGFEWYEISNLSRPGFESKHNRSYWQNKAYLGLGPSAHSYDGRVRSWNIRSNQAYLQTIEKGILPLTLEPYREIDRINEIIMTRLRTREGLGKEDLKQFAEETIWDAILKNTLSNKYANVMNIEKNRLTLRKEGLLFADAIAASLFIV